MNKDEIHIGDHILVDEHIYVVVRKHNESAFCCNIDTGYKAHIDYSDIERKVIVV